MRYTALLTILTGVVIACFAGVHYATGVSDETENSFVIRLLLPMVVAIALVTTGTGLWVVGGRWSAVSGPTSGRDSVGWTGQ